MALLSIVTLHISRCENIMNFHFKKLTSHLSYLSKLLLVETDMEKDARICKQQEDHGVALN